MRILRGLAVVAAVVGLAACGQAGDSAGTAAEGATEASADTPELPAAGQLEVGFDRPSGDYHNAHGVADAGACQTLCEEDEACLAFTWVQAGVQAEEPVCWLKNQVPGPVEAEWATSGVMPGREPAASE